MIYRGKKSQRLKRDDFLQTLDGIFMIAKYFGVVTYEMDCATLYNFVVVLFFHFVCILLFLMLLILEVCAIWKLVKVFSSDKLNEGGIIVARLSGSIFYGNALLSLVLSSRFMTSWQSMAAYWHRTDLAARLDLPPDLRIRKRTLCVAVFVATCAFAEHILSMMSATGLEIAPEMYFSEYILSSHGFLLEPQDYTLWLAIPIFVLSKLATALWNFQDLIIMLISMGLASRYYRLNLYVTHLVKIEKRSKIEQKFGTALSLHTHVWRKVRQAYVRQAALVRMLDRKLGALVLLSNANNLYFICLQLYLGIHREKGSPINRGYYLLSLSWLLFRACGVVLAAADVHSHSQRALTPLSNCPSAAYNVEVKRLRYQLKNDSVALTGMGLFSLQKKLLLQVAAAVVKYELVLIQYDR